MLLARARNKDLIAVDVTGRGVVPAMRDAPGVVRDAESRVEDPSNGVVDRLALGETLMTALMSDDPEAGAGEAGPEPKDVPEGERESLRAVVTKAAITWAGEPGQIGRICEIRLKIANNVQERNERWDLLRKGKAGCDEDEVLDAGGGKGRRKSIRRCRRED